MAMQPNILLDKTQVARAYVNFPGITECQTCDDPVHTIKLTRNKYYFSTYASAVGFPETTTYSRSASFRFSNNFNISEK